MNPDIVAAVAQIAAGQTLNVAEFCREHHLSRTVFYKYVTRFRAEGAAGFTRRSTAPHHRPTTTTDTVCEAVVRARAQLDDEGLDNGAISIGWRLEDTGTTPVPSRATIHRILVERGLVIPAPKKKPPTRRRFEYADPNGLWQIDGMEFRLATGETVCVVQILDDHSRLDVGSYAARSENGADTWTALQHAFAGHGLPVKVLSDNGLAFSGKHRGAMVDLERHLAEKGITTIASTVRHPQTCGKNERVHRTLRRWLRKHPTPHTLEALQHLLEQYRVVYNNRRHQSLNGKTPQQRHDAKPRVAPDGTVTGSAGVTQRPVSATGVVTFAGCAIIIGRRWKHRMAILHWQGQRVSIMIDDTVVRVLTLDRTVRYQRLP